MQPHFRNLVDLLDPLFRQLRKMEPVTIDMLPEGMPDAGIYLFSERGKPLYVGRTNRLRARLQEHCRPSSAHNSAPFAFTLARKATKNPTATYRKTGSRSALEKDRLFRAAFVREKAHVRRMGIQFVGEDDPTRQALLEIYVAIALKTPHNDFDNH